MRSVNERRRRDSRARKRHRRFPAIYYKRGFFVSSDFSKDALAEIDAFFRKSGRIIIALTVKEILNEQIARKLA